jgi:glycosyl transferase family 87
MPLRLTHAEEVSAVPEEGEEHLVSHGLVEAARRVVDPVAVGVILLVVGWWWLTLAVQATPGDWAFDFRQFWQGGNDVVNGVSPYPASSQLASAGDQLDPEGIRDVFRFPYPAGAAVLLAPFGLLGFHAAAAIWSALLIASLLGALWILGVRDWRVLGVVVTAAPVITAVRLGTFTPVLVLLLAVAWRWRDRRWVAGASLALAITLKLFVWPLVVWLAATRRYGAAAIAACFAGLLTFGAWAAIGFDGLTRYPELLRRLTDVVAARGLSLVALGSELGLPDAVAGVLPWIVGSGLLAGVALAARRADGDPVAYSFAVVASIALSPIVWLHYFALLVLPLAVMRPRFAWPWLLLWVFWLMPDQENQGELWRILLAAAAVGLVAGMAVKSGGNRRTARRES